MKIERSLYTKPFTKDRVPLWHCPTCSRGILKAEISDFTSQESIISKNNQTNPDWDPTWINGAFIGKIICDNIHCREIIFLLGRMRINETKKYNEQHGIWEFEQTEYLYPQTFKPTLNIFRINEDIPGNIQAAIADAFALFWMDEGSCANKIRKVVELIMDERKVTKTYISNNKRKQKTLHQRIELFKNMNQEAADYLMAVKWIGNSGSHANDTLDKEDLLDGLEMLRHVTNKLYEKESLRIKRLAKKINKFKGPTKRR